MSEKQTSFLTEALIISVSNFIVKIIGVVFRIPLANLFQGNMEVFTAAYSVYAMLYMVSTSGLPVAISRTVASSHKKGKSLETKRIFEVSVILFGVVGMVFTLLMYFGSDAIASYTEHADAAFAMRIISPTLFLVCVSSAIRGYYQGLRNMIPTAVSQLIEAMLKLMIGLGGAYIAVKKGYSPAIQGAYAISGITIGMIIALVFLIVYRYFYERKHSSPPALKSVSYGTITGRLIRIAIPVTLTSSALYLSQFLDTVVIKKFLLISGVNQETASGLYTAYTSLSLSISDLLPATLVYPIAVSVLPAISASLAVNDNKSADRYIHSSIRISGIIALPCAFGLLAVSRQAITLLYGADWGGDLLWNGETVSSVAVASGGLMILSVGIIFISLLSTTNALLQAIGQQHLPTVSVLCGVGVLVALEIGLVSIPSIGIYGAPIASVGCYITALSMNMFFLKKKRGYSKSLFRVFLCPFVCAVLCGLSAYLAAAITEAVLPEGSRLTAFVSLICAAVTGVGAYVASMLALHGITPNEVRLLPKGNAICSLLIRKGWLHEKHVR